MDNEAIIYDKSLYKDCSDYKIQDLVSASNFYDYTLDGTVMFNIPN